MLIKGASDNLARMTLAQEFQQIRVTTQAYEMIFPSNWNLDLWCKISNIAV